MVSPDLGSRLEDIRDGIAAIADFTAGRTFDDYSAQTMLRHAVERCLGIVAEASRHIPPGLRARHPDVPWRDVVAVGDVLRYGYDQVVDARVWEIVTRDLQPLKAAVETMLREVVAAGGAE